MSKKTYKIIDRREFLRLASYSLLGAAASSCAYARIDPNHFLIRSDVISSLEQEKEILSRAKLEWTEDGVIRVLYVKGTPYEMGYQHGVLLRDQIQDNLGYLYDQVLKKFHSKEIFAECYERARPFIPQDYVDEMHGLAHGARIPLEMVHHIHILPEMTEWGGKKRIKSVVKQMINGDLGTSCSNFCAYDSATKDNKFYAVRILDWGLHRLSKLEEYPLLKISVPNNGLASVNIGWVGFLGAISGMNEAGITLGEMGYGDIPNETLRGVPMPFMLREVLTHAHNLKDVRKVISESIGTNSFVYLMSDGKSKQAEMYIRDRDRFVVVKPNQVLKDRKNDLPAIKDVVYGGHYQDRMIDELTSKHGKLTPEIILSEVIPRMAMPSNFQNVLYAPEELNFWVSYARGKKARAAEQPYTYFDFKRALMEFRKG